MTPLGIVIPLAALLLLAATLGAYFTVALVRIRATTRTLPTARAGLGLPVPTGAVHLIVPAHDEEATLPALIASLRAQTHPALRVTLALDRCTDSSAAVARAAIDADPRFHVVQIAQCPADWAGKVHAVHAALITPHPAAAHDPHATPAFYCFTDADCVFDPAALAAACALTEHRRLDMLSLFSTLTADAWYELLVQPAAAFELARQYPLLKANHPDPAARRPFANGQFMLFRADAYHAVGTHAAVKDALLEDIAFARLLTAQGHRTGLLLADGLVRCRMYHSWKQFRTGWKRIYTESANRRAARLRTLGHRGRFLGTVLPASAIAAVALTLAAVPSADIPLRALGLGIPVYGLLAWLAAMGLVQRSSHAPIWAAPFHALGAWLVGTILLDAARDLSARRPTQWAGRTYDRPAR